MNSLVVDDEMTVRMLMQKLLSQYGNCDAAANGHEALQAFLNSVQTNQLYDLICLDIKMPVMDGKEVLKHIKAIEKKAKISENKRAKIFMVSALDDSQVILETVVKLGCSSYILKPINKIQLIARLKEFKLI